MSEHTINIVYPNNFDEVIMEQGDLPNSLKKGDEVNSHLPAVLLKFVFKLEKDLLDVTEGTSLDMKRVLSMFYKKMCDLNHPIKDHVFYNMLIGSLRSQRQSIKQVWIAIIYGVTGTVTSFSNIDKVDIMGQFSKKRKCPMLQKDADSGKTIFYSPETIDGDTALFEAMRTWFDYDEEVIVEGKVYEMSSDNTWYVIADEFNKIMKSKAITYNDGDKVTVHNCLVSMALSKYPLARSPVFKAPVKTLGSQIRTEITKDEQNLLECINYQLNRTTFEIGARSVVDSSYIIKKALPIVMYKKTVQTTELNKETGEKITKSTPVVERRSYAPFGWHKMNQEMKGKDKKSLPNYSEISVLARSCATGWVKVLPEIQKISITQDNINDFTMNVRAIVSISQNLKKLWVKGEAAKVVRGLKALSKFMQYIPKYMTCNVSAIQQSEKGDVSSIEAAIAKEEELASANDPRESISE